MTTIALAGATGLVGGALLELALADDRVTHIVAPTRKSLQAHPKLHAPLVDFASLPSIADWWSVDAAICALGTTQAQAGSRAAFWRIDHGFPLAFAEHVHRYGVSRFVLVSAAGAQARSPFLYLRVKGSLEEDLRTIGFPSLTLVRPGLIDGQRTIERRRERRAVAILRSLGPILPAAMRINPAIAIAHVLLEAALTQSRGVHIVKADQLGGLEKERGLDR